jgi:hypothetical protein
LYTSSGRADRGIASQASVKRLHASGLPSNVPSRSVESSRNFDEWPPWPDANRRVVASAALPRKPDIRLIAIVPRFVPVVVIECHRCRHAVLDRRDNLMRDARPREKTARLVCSHPCESIAESRVSKNFCHHDPQIFAIEWIGKQRMPPKRQGAI